jgi:hypothetical protein
MGFERVRVLVLPENFGRDWAARGYPVARQDRPSVIRVAR